MDEARKTLARRLFDTGCFLDKKRSPDGKGFRLKLHEKHPDAPLSPFYLNLRTPDNPTKPGPLTPELVEMIGSQMFGLFRAIVHKADRVLGVPRAGDPLAASFSEITGIPRLLLNKEEGETGRRIGETLQGSYYRGETVLLIDDLITKADSKLEAIEALYAAGLRVTAVFVVVDREQGGTEELQKRGYTLHSLLTITDLLDLYADERLISMAEWEEILTYIRTSA